MNRKISETIFIFQIILEKPEHSVLNHFVHSRVTRVMACFTFQDILNGRKYKLCSIHRNLNIVVFKTFILLNFVSLFLLCFKTRYIILEFNNNQFTFLCSIKLQMFQAKKRIPISNIFKILNKK